MDSIIIYLKFNYIIITLHMLFLNFVERFQKLARCSIMHGKDCHFKNYEYFIWCGRQAVTLWFLYLYKQLTIRCRPSYTWTTLASRGIFSSISLIYSLFSFFGIEKAILEFQMENDMESGVFQLGKCSLKKQLAYHS
jgi:hypothetical protein